ncbi:unnamed protein product [Vicia faba]|uniref:Uncharacterized protein n=1 Tax=Vicia faba TaxID=3906 RepID=A0AAV1AI81_VICFA|nr:unnamed protein product [Vicia faba]
MTVVASLEKEMVLPDAEAAVVAVVEVLLSVSRLNQYIEHQDEDIIHEDHYSSPVEDIVEDLDQGIFLETMTVVEILVFPVMILVAAAERVGMVEQRFLWWPWWTRTSH